MKTLFPRDFCSFLRSAAMYGDFNALENVRTKTTPEYRTLQTGFETVF